MKKIWNYLTQKAYKEFINGKILDYFVRISTRNGYIELVKYLVFSGANIHAKNDEVVVWAAENCHLDVVEYLVGLKANIHVYNSLAVILAARNGHLNVVKYLVEQCVAADIHAAVRSAAEYGHFDDVEYLIGL